MKLYYLKDNFELKEEFNTYINGQPIYKNPTKNEMKDILRNQNEGVSKDYWDYDFRFIATKNKDFYVFSANVLHQTVCVRLNLGYGFDTGFFGGGVYDEKENVLKHMLPNYQVIKKTYDIFSKMDFSFADKYFEKPLNELIKENYEKNRRK